MVTGSDRASASGSKYYIEPGRAAERPEVAVSREESKASVNAALGDQCVAESRLPSFGEHF